MINTIDGIISAARGGKTGVIAVAAAHDQPVIEAVVEAKTGANIEGAITIKKAEETENKEVVKIDGKED